MKHKWKGVTRLVYNEPAIQLAKEVWAPTDVIRESCCKDHLGFGAPASSMSHIPIFTYQQIRKSLATTS